MKTKFTFALTLLLLTVVTVSAQFRPSSSRKDDGGLFFSVGTNIMNITGYDEILGYDTNSKLGLDLALGWESQIKGMVSSVSLDYAMCGYQYNIDGKTAKVTYPSLGFNVNLMVGVMKNIYLGSGFGLYYMFDGNATYDGSSQSVDCGSSVDLRVPIIARCYFMRHLFVDVRYNIGLFDMSGVESLGGNRNRGVQLSVGLVM